MSWVLTYKVNETHVGSANNSSIHFNKIACCYSCSHIMIFSLVVARIHNKMINIKLFQEFVVHARLICFYNAMYTIRCLGSAMSHTMMSGFKMSCSHSVIVETILRVFNQVPVSALYINAMYYDLTLGILFHIDRRAKQVAKRNRTYTHFDMTSYHKFNIQIKQHIIKYYKI